MVRNKVMIVDDAPFMRTMIRDILEPQGFEIVGEAGDGDEVVPKFRELKPDIVTLDIVMPRKSGVEALRELMRENPKPKVIMITAIDQREALMEAIRLGAMEFIVKPFEEERVLDAVKKASEA